MLAAGSGAGAGAVDASFPGWPAAAGVGAVSLVSPAISAGFAPVSRAVPDCGRFGSANVPLPPSLLSGPAAENDGSVALVSPGDGSPVKSEATLGCRPVPSALSCEMAPCPGGFWPGLLSRKTGSSRPATSSTRGARYHNFLFMLIALPGGLAVQARGKPWLRTRPWSPPHVAGRSRPDSPRRALLPLLPLGSLSPTGKFDRHR